MVRNYIFWFGLAVDITFNSLIFGFCFYAIVGYFISNVCSAKVIKFAFSPYLVHLTNGMNIKANSVKDGIPDELIEGMLVNRLAIIEHLLTNSLTSNCHKKNASILPWYKCLDEALLLFVKVKFWFIHELKSSFLFFRVALIFYNKGQLFVSVLKISFSGLFKRHHVLHTNSIDVFGMFFQDSQKSVDIEYFFQQAAISNSESTEHEKTIEVIPSSEFERASDFDIPKNLRAIHLDQLRDDMLARFTAFFILFCNAFLKQSLVMAIGKLNCSQLLKLNGNPC